MNKVTNYIVCLSAAVAVVIACVLLFPHHRSNFKYHFELGKPWSYSLLTAEEDYPIYKTEQQLQQERQQVLRNFVPYFTIQTDMLQKQWEQLILTEEAAELSKRGSEYLYQQMQRAYQMGIISVQDQQQLTAQGYKRITLMDNDHIAKTARVSLLYTPRSAYSMITDNAPALQGSKLKKLELESYLVPNIIFDSLTTEAVKESLMDDISLTEGVVQQGEKIIDKGEIVDERTYQILSSIRRAYDEREGDRKSEIVSTISEALLLFIIMGMLVMYLAIFRPRFMESWRNVLFLFSLMLTVILLACLTLRYTPISIYLVPFVWIAVIVRIFFDSRTGFIAHLCTILMVSLVVSMPLEFIIIQVAAGVVAVGGLRDITQRSQLAQSAGWILLAYIVTYSLYTLCTTGDWHMLRPGIYLCFGLNALLVVFAYGLIYLIEKIFGFVSSMTLVELTNVNNNLLREFAEKAAGSFQHSMQVSTLAFEAAKHIGANALLVRTGALYHDIGKMQNPHYFTENQFDGVNPLSEMDFAKAAQTIIGHVSEGLKIAKKEKLPSVIQQFIASHHGTSKVRYFYNSYLNAHPGEKVDESLFTYQGPKPTTKETAILMMADAVEARSRSLTEYTEESIGQMVEQMIDAQIADGQFKETPISFRDVERVKEVFTERLISMNHHRIAYPELKNK